MQPARTSLRVAQCPSSLDLLALHSHAPKRYPFLIESNSSVPGQVAAQGCFDILFALPGEALELPAQAAGHPDFLASLDSWFAREQIPADPGLGLPFAGGWFLYLGYELAGQIEPALKLPAARAHLPTALAVRCPAAFIHDRIHDRVYAVAETDAQLDCLRNDCAGAPASNHRPLPTATIEEESAQRYLRHVDAVREYILAGDVFQVNLSREWHARLSAPASAADIYHALRRANPAPFAGLMQWRDTAVISSSPERLLRIDNGIAETRPIAGTRARIGADAPVLRELLANPKERAEHVMLIDLERNDLGRVCDYGSIEVNEFMVQESYRHVHHIVSNVRGRLREGVGPGAALRAVFPGGTITGCPKVRCMEIIAELEASGRGAYTGAMGYLSRDGRLDSNILIRSLVARDRDVWLRAGGGIVADSNPQNELDETRAKARGLLASLGISK